MYIWRIFLDWIFEVGLRTRPFLEGKWKWPFWFFVCLLLLYFWTSKMENGKNNLTLTLFCCCILYFLRVFCIFEQGRQMVILTLALFWCILFWSLCCSILLLLLLLHICYWNTASALKLSFLSPMTWKCQKQHKQCSFQDFESLLWMIFRCKNRQLCW